MENVGMFDEIRCKMALPIEIDVEHREHWFQTKSLNCSMDNYEIREDGSLWCETYDTEDRSDPNAVGLFALAGCLTRVNKQWIPCSSFTGEIVFYTQASSIADEESASGWIEFSAYFVSGQIREFELLNYEMPSNGV